jgi:ribosomal protein L40E
MADYMDKGLKKFGITISKPTLAIACIAAGILVILFPSLLVWTVGLFLVIQGALLLTDYYEQERQITTTTSKGVICRNCGAGNTKEAEYCTKCGRELIQTGVTITAGPPRNAEKNLSKLA